MERPCARCGREKAGKRRHMHLMACEQLRMNMAHLTSAASYTYMHRGPPPRWLEVVVSGEQQRGGVVEGEQRQGGVNPGGPSSSADERDAGAGADAGEQEPSEPDSDVTLTDDDHVAREQEAGGSD